MLRSFSATIISQVVSGGKGGEKHLLVATRWHPNHGPLTCAGGETGGGKKKWV